MATPSEKLAESLDVLRALQEQNIVAIRSSDLTRTHRERLKANGFLQEVMKGWYIPARPGETSGESTAWYTAFWHFMATYLETRFDKNWCLAPELSLSLHTGDRTVPEQLLVRSIKSRNRVTALPYGTSILDIRSTLPEEKDVDEIEGLRVFSLTAALVACSAQYYKQKPTDARAALSVISDASEVLDRLLEGGHSTIAGRLAGAFRNIGRNRIADDIVKTMRAAGYDVRENDPFESQPALAFSTRERSPYVNRIRLMWQEMREPIIEIFPPAPGLTKNVNKYLKQVEDIYVTDAYHSLSIEGYHVSPELIERVRSGNWNPDINANVREDKNALAARGYWQAYQAVRKSVRRVLQNENSGTVADEDHANWYREMFAPGVATGLLKPSNLAGYRNCPVYTRRSKHTPPNQEAVRDAMPEFFNLLREETDPAVRVVLGHFIFVYIHPYVDGNGRMGRFLMNLMLAASGHPWTIIPVEQRNEYRAALEEASVQQDIIPFTRFLSALINKEKP